METQTRQIEAQRTRAQFDVSTFNEENRTVEVTAATERAVRMFSWEEYDIVDEILVCNSESCDLVRLNASAPLLDNHMRYGKTAEAVVGVVERSWFEQGQLRALVRFGKSKDDTELMEKVRDGIVTGVSLGYNVYEYQVTRSEGKRPQYKATKWEPFEISFTPVQADVDSRSRSAETQESKNDVVITENLDSVDDFPEHANPDINEITAVEGEQIIDNQIENNMAEQITPSAEALEQERKQAETAERTRAKSIRDLGKMRTFNGVSPEFFDALVDEGVSLETARERAIAEYEKLQPINPRGNAANDVTESDRTRTAMANALTLRMYPSVAKEMGEENVRAAKYFKNMSLLRMAEEALIAEGVNTRGMNNREIAVLALGGKVRGLHHTTDFPLLLLDTINRSLLAGYEQVERTFMMWTRRSSIKDFRPVTRVRLSEMLGGLELVREGEEYKYTTMTENGETIQLAKYGKVFGVTWEAIVNDDLDALSRVPQAFANSAAIKQTELVYGILKTNPLMSDGNALFSAAHNNYKGNAGNLTTGGTALNEASLSEALTKFRTQKNEAGQFIRVSPKFLIVGPLNEYAAERLTTANILPNVQANQAIKAFLGLTVIVDPELEGYEWFLAADPATIDTVEVSYLDGESELFIDTEEGFNIDGVKTKARMVFAAKAMDFRGLYRNNGAAPA